MRAAFAGTVEPRLPGPELSTGRAPLRQQGPGGVGVFRDPSLFVEPGDPVRREGEEIGRVENRVIDSATGIT